MKKLAQIFFVLAMVSSVGSAEDCILENDYLKAFISGDDSTFGTGKGDDNSLGIYNKKVGTDYLTKGIHFEFFSLKYDNNVYAHDNSDAGKYYKIKGSIKYDLPDKRVNKKEYPTDLHCISDREVTSTTKIENKLEVMHNYRLKLINMNSSSIEISVSVSNISNSPINSVKYARGLDPDPNGVDTINSQGFKKPKISKRDFISTKGLENKAPIGILTREKKLTHNVAAIDMGRESLHYDPDKILEQDPIVSTTTDDSAIYIAFDLGRLEKDQKKTFSFQYILSTTPGDMFKKPEKASGKLSRRQEIVQYKYVDRFELVKRSSNTIVFEIEKGKKIKKPNERKHKYKLNVTGIPQGIELHFGKQVINKKQNTINLRGFKYDKKIEFSVWRNKKYSSKGKESVTFKLLGDDGIKSTINTLVFNPKPRKITFKIATSDTVNINLSQLESSEPIPIIILADGQEISPEEYKQFDFDVDVDGIGWHKVLLDSGKTAIQLNLESLTRFGLVPMYILTKTGEKLPVSVGVEAGVYPGDTAEGTLYVKIIDDMTWWEKWKTLIYLILGTLLFSWYIIGVWKKDTFSRSQTIDKYRIYEDDDFTRVFPPTKFKKKVGWWQKLIPYKSEWSVMDGMKFIASSRHNMIYLAKKSQSGLKVDGIAIDNPGKGLKQIYSNSKISTDTEEYNIK